MYMNFQSSFICNSQKIDDNPNVFQEANGWTVVHVCSGLHLRSKKESTADHSGLGGGDLQYG